MATTPKPTEENSTSTKKTSTPKPAASTPKATTAEPQEKVSTASSERVIPGLSQEVINTLTSEINLMMAFAGNNGLIINTEVNGLIQSESIDDLINAHNLLCKNVAPATPKSIGYTNRIRMNNRTRSVFRQIPLVRNLILLALFFLIAFVLTAITPEVSNDSLDKGVLGNDGWSLFYNLSFLASVAGLGVLFHLLKSVATSVRRSTLVPEETINYIAQILLGVISGLLLSEVIIFYTQDSENINLFNKSVLALVGGFSSDAIFTVLEGLITRLKSIFTPSNTA